MDEDAWPEEEQGEGGYQRQQFFQPQHTSFNTGGPGQLMEVGFGVGGAASLQQGAYPQVPNEGMGFMQQNFLMQQQFQANFQGQMMRGFGWNQGGAPIRQPPFGRGGFKSRGARPPFHQNRGGGGGGGGAQGDFST
jgi:hypothetical protein